MELVRGFIALAGVKPLGCGDRDREHKSNGNERAHHSVFFLVPKMTGEGNGTDSTVSTDMLS